MEARIKIRSHLSKACLLLQRPSRDWQLRIKISWPSPAQDFVSVLRRFVLNIWGTSVKCETKCWFYCRDLHEVRNHRAEFCASPVLNSILIAENLKRYIYIQGVTEGMCQTSGGCSLC
jgi:hypothetical protein